MKWILIVAGSLVAIVALAAIIGLLLPKGHVASKSIKLKRPPEEVWRAITDYAAMPKWRRKMDKIERLPDQNGHPVWQEIYSNGWKLPLEEERAEPPARLVRRIADPSLPFGGYWEYELSAANGGSLLRVTEHGEVSNPIFRLVGKFMDPSATIRDYLEDLAKHFDEEARIE